MNVDFALWRRALITEMVSDPAVVMRIRSIGDEKNLLKSTAYPCRASARKLLIFKRF